MNFKETFLEVVYAVLPIAVLVAVLQFTIAKLPADVFARFLAGTVMIIIGLAFFLIGAKMGVLPAGELIGSVITSKGKLWIILLSGFLLGFVVTLAEPDVQVLASQVDGVSEGAIPKVMLIAAVALGVAIFVALAMLRIFMKVPLIYIITGGYILAFLLAVFTSPQFVGVSFDAGGVTTGPMTVPFILALGVGVTSVTGRRQNSNDSFGIVALASIGPILAVLILGVLYR